MVASLLPRMAAGAENAEVIDLFAADPVPPPVSAAESGGTMPLSPAPDRGASEVPIAPASQPKEARARAAERTVGTRSRPAPLPVSPLPVPALPGLPSPGTAADSEAQALGGLGGLLARLGIVAPEEEERYDGERQRPTAVWAPDVWARRLPVADSRIRALRERLAEFRRRTATGACLLWPWRQEYRLAPFPEAPLLWPENAYARYVREGGDAKMRAERLRRLAPSGTELFAILGEPSAGSEEDPWSEIPDPVSLAFPWGSLVLAVADRAFAPATIVPPRFADLPAPGEAGFSWIAWSAARRLELEIRRERLLAQGRLLARIAAGSTAEKARSAPAAEIAEFDARIEALLRELASGRNPGRTAVAELDRRIDSLETDYRRLRKRIAALPGAAGIPIPSGADPADFLDEQITAAARVCPSLWRRGRLYRQFRTAAPELAAILLSGLDRELAALGGRCRLLAADLLRLATAPPVGAEDPSRAYLESRIADQTIRLLEAAAFYRVRSAQRLAVLAARLPREAATALPEIDGNFLLAGANRDIAYSLRSREVTNEPEGWLDPPQAIRLFFEWHGSIRTDRPEVFRKLREAEREMLAELVDALTSAETRLWRVLDGGLRATCAADLEMIAEAQRKGWVDGNTAARWRKAVAARYTELLELARTPPSKRLFALTFLAPEVRDALVPGAAFRLAPEEVAETAGDRGTER